MSDQSPASLHCYKHPERETLLRCNRCNQPICSSCAVRTPTGYRCKDCINGQQKIFDTARTGDIILGVVIALILGFVGGYASAMGFLTLFLAPIVGVIIAETVRWAVKKRRSRLLAQVTTAAAALGSLPHVIITIVSILMVSQMGGSFAVSLLLPLLWKGAFTFLVASTVYYRLQGIRIPG